VGQDWGKSLAVLHAWPDVLQLIWVLVVYPFGVHLNWHGEVLVTHLLGDVREITMRE